SSPRQRPRSVANFIALSPCDSSARFILAPSFGAIQKPDRSCVTSTGHIACRRHSNLVEAALRIDPLKPLAHRVRGLVFFNRIWWGETAHDAASVARAMELARTALRLAPRDEYAHYLMALAHAEAGQLEDAIAECERGLDINPNCSLILGELAN